MEQIGQPLVFDVHYRKDGESVPSLTVTVDAYRNGTSLVTGGSATEVGSGIYTYTIASGSVTAAGVYRVVFKTAGDVDEKHLAANRMVGSEWVENVDEPVSSRSSHDPSDVADVILIAPANRLATDDNGHVTAENVLQQVEEARVKLHDNQPDYAPAKAGDAMTLTAAYDAAKTAGDATAANQDTISDAIALLLTRLSAARAGYLDKLNVSGTLAHSDAAATYRSDVSALALQATALLVKAKTDQLAFDGGKVEAIVADIDLGEVEFVFPATESAQLAYIFSRISAVPGTVEDGVLLFPPLTSADLQAVGAIVLQGVDPVPQPEAKMTATLVSSAPTVTFRGAIMGRRVFEAKTQPNGAVILQLPRNADITPSGSEWRIVITARNEVVFDQTMTVGDSEINLGELIT